MTRPVSEWVAKYSDRLGKVDWAAAASEWNRMKPTFVGNYTGAPGLNPNVAAKYRNGIDNATYRAPDVAKAKANYAAKMTGSG